MACVAWSLLLWTHLCLCASLGSEETLRGANSSETTETEDQGPELPPIPVFSLRLRVVDCISSLPLASVSVVFFVDFQPVKWEQTEESGEVWFSLQPQGGAVVAAVASKPGYMPALMPVTTHSMPGPQGGSFGCCGEGGVGSLGCCGRAGEVLRVLCGAGWGPLGAVARGGWGP
uniref:Uncharacterized protein n=1 Tax=Knipowitschia caucasica TaxID=637954 RepID=A0AAV2JUU7_KNICA